MARTLLTARKNTSVRDRAKEKVDRYYECQRREGEELVEFVAHFWTLWGRAHPYGVVGYDGIVRLIGHLPRLWKEWAEATAKRFLQRKAPSCELDGNMHGFIKAMFEGLIDNPDGPPSAFTVEPPTIPLELPPWTFLGHGSGGRDEGVSSWPPRAKRVRTEAADWDDSDDKGEEGTEDHHFEAEEDNDDYHAEDESEEHHTGDAKERE